MVTSIINALTGPVSTLLDKWIPDADTKAKLAHDIATMSANQAHEMALAQVRVNEKEAAHKSLFVAGWRPALGWVCALAYFVTFIARPFAMAVFGWDLPALDMTELAGLTFGMLGLGTMRTIEKTKGAAREK